MRRRTFIQDPNSRLATWALRMAVFSLIATVLDVFIVFFDVLEFRPALATVAGSIALALIALLLAFGGFAVIWKDGLGGLGSAVGAIAISLGLLGYPAYLAAITKAKKVMATYADMEELIRLGAYRSGSSPEVDEAIALHAPLEAFLRQAKDEVSTLGDGYRRLEQILKGLETES